MNAVIYGIRNCDTVRKARAWLDGHGVAHSFHDYKAAGIDASRLRSWCSALGWEILINRAGTTFRKLPESQKSGLDEARAVALMLAHHSLIRRPVLETGDGRLLVGFRADDYAEVFHTTD